MTLLDRIAARQTCAVVACDRHRIEGSLFCRDHLNDMWANRLDRQADGTFVETGPRWLANLQARDETGRMAA